MECFTCLEGVAAPFPKNHVDTDVIYPGRFLSTIRRTGLGHLLFHGLRFNPDGSERPDFVLNKPAYRQAKILVAGDNFGCGSSREHAPWALMGFGIRCIVSTSFADIFSGNCIKNGILCISLDSDTVSLLMGDADKGLSLRVDLVTHQIMRPSGDVIHFEVPGEVREKLLNGTDDVRVTLESASAIDGFESRLEQNQPWI